MNCNLLKADADAHTLVNVLQVLRDSDKYSLLFNVRYYCRIARRDATKTANCWTIDEPIEKENHSTVPFMLSKHRSKNRIQPPSGTE